MIRIWGGSAKNMTLNGGEGAWGGGGTQSPYIYNTFFCDISLITRRSNKQVSHFSLHKDITKVISKGRDRLVEIGSNSLLSYKCK